MKNYSEFHDGFLDGLWVDDHTAHLYLRTATNLAFTLVASKVVRLAVSDFKEGNIIFDLITRSGDEISIDDICCVYDVRDKDPASASQISRLLAKAMEEELSILEIAPSYGATGIILAQSFDLITRDEWLDRYFRNTQLKNFGTEIF